jgi:cyanophycinase
MSIFLVGAGPDPEAFPAVFDHFAREVAELAGSAPARIAVVVHDRGGNPASRLAEYVEPLRARLRFQPMEVLLGLNRPVDPGVFDGVHGILVGGGLTPAYYDGLAGAGPGIVRAVTAGAPYAGFSAGAMVAPARALVGGFRVDGVEVCGEECSEGLDALDIRDGLGLAPFTVDVHASQAGTLGRAVGAVAAGLASRAVAIDENTALVLVAPGAEDYEVIGSGSCWDIRGSAGSGRSGPGSSGGPVAVSIMRPGA